MPRWSKRLTCFYCGCRSANSFPAGIRRWECKKCEAVNHLDEDGQITDPPATASQPETRFARARPRSESPRGLATNDESPFCKRCEQNQIIVKDILTEYTPPSTGDWEKSYKAYVKGLHETYPPVCDDCEAQIRERMKNSDYFVSADNLGRTLRRKNESWVDRHGWQYDIVSVLLTLGKLMWFMSWIGQSTWHAMNIVKPERHSEFLWDDAASSSLSGCARQIFSLAPLQEVCGDRVTRLVGRALTLGLLSVWWNPLWVNKMKLLYGRPAGRKEYYQLQVMFLALRCAGWNFTAKLGDLEFDAPQWKGLHAFMLALTLLSAILPYRTIRWDSSPRVTRTYSPGSLLAQKPREARATSRPNQPNFISQAHQNFAGSRSSQPTQTFPINQLAQPQPSQKQFVPHQYHPPTPPDEDAMDWEETRAQHQYDLRPSTSYRDTHQNPTQRKPLAQPSPFYGHLPPQPTSQAHALRNPPYRPAPMERAQAQQSNFFSRNSRSKFKIDDGASETTSPASTRGIWTDEDADGYLSPIKMGPQKFFPGNVYGQDTGIEELFDRATTLGKGAGRGIGDPVGRQGGGGGELRTAVRREGRQSFGRVWGLSVGVVVMAGLAFVVRRYGYG